MRQFFMILIAVVCLIAGAITLALPLPTGLFLLAVGLGIILMENRSARVQFWGYRRKKPWLDRKIRQIERFLPADLRRALGGRGKRRA